MAKVKVRQHNEWFRPVSKTTCECGAKKVQVWTWGEYVNGKWRNVKQFCAQCFVARVKGALLAHAKPCGCQINLVAYHSILPDYMVKLQEQLNTMVCEVKNAKAKIG